METREKVHEAIAETEAWLVELRHRMIEHDPQGELLIGTPFPKSRTVKISAPIDTHHALIRRSRDRGVTVNYLILETLKEAGYPVDLDSVEKTYRKREGEGA